jgi:hypothetical protein
MMMERSKPAAPAAPEQDAKPSSSSSSAAAASETLDANTIIPTTTMNANNASSEDRVRALERRLDALDSAKEKNTITNVVATTIANNNNTLHAMEDTAATSAIPARESDASSTTAPLSPKNPLLVRYAFTCLVRQMLLRYLYVSSSSNPPRLSCFMFLLASITHNHVRTKIDQQHTIQQHYLETNPGCPRTCTACGAEGKRSQEKNCEGKRRRRGRRTHPPASSRGRHRRRNCAESHGVVTTSRT